MGDYFSNEDYDEFKEDYKKFFPNGISSKELGTVMRALGKQNISEDELKEMVEEVDASGIVGEKAFMELMFNKKLKSSEIEEEYIEAFKVFDRDGNGLISLAELKHVMANLGEKLSDEEIEMMLKGADLDLDGAVNYQDFVRMMLGKS